MKCIPTNIASATMWAGFGVFSYYAALMWNKTPSRWQIISLHASVQGAAGLCVSLPRLYAPAFLSDARNLWTFSGQSLAERLMTSLAVRVGSTKDVGPPWLRARTISLMSSQRRRPTRLDSARRQPLLVSCMEVWCSSADVAEEKLVRIH